MNILFHIGWTKTGTTALQSWLAGHDSELDELGVLYPTTGRDSVGAHNPLVFPLINDPHFPARTSAETIWGELVQEIEQKCDKKPYHTVIVSSEILSLVHDLNGVVRRLGPRGHSMSLLAVVREQREMLRSLYAQHVFDPHLASTEDFMQTFESTKKRFLYHEHLTRYRDPGLWQQFTVLKYHPGINDDILGLFDWSARIGTRPSRANVTPSSSTVEVLRLLNKIEMPLPARKAVNQAVIDSTALSTKERLVITEDNMRTIHAYYEESNAALLRDFSIDLSQKAPF